MALVMFFVQMLMQIGQVIKSLGVTKLTHRVSGKARLGSVSVSQMVLELSVVESWQTSNEVAFVVNTELADSFSVLHVKVLLKRSYGGLLRLRRSVVGEVTLLTGAGKKW